MLLLPIIPFPAINPVLISIGPFAVRWYALAYIVGITAGWLYARAIISSERLWGGRAPFTVTDFDDFVIWITLGIILGGRIGYVLFYNFAHFAANPIEILQLWNGGMSFHGGVLGCTLAIVLFALRRHIPVLSLGDVTAAVAPIGLLLGRLANFINGELWGRATDVPWAMVFPHGGPVARHPSQLYEGASRASYYSLCSPCSSAPARSSDPALSPASSRSAMAWRGSPVNFFASRTCSSVSYGAGSRWACCSASRCC